MPRKFPTSFSVSYRSWHQLQCSTGLHVKIFFILQVHVLQQWDDLIGSRSSMGLIGNEEYLVKLEGDDLQSNGQASFKYDVSTFKPVNKAVDNWRTHASGLAFDPLTTSKRPLPESFHYTLSSAATAVIRNGDRRHKDNADRWSNKIINKLTTVVIWTKCDQYVTWQLRQVRLRTNGKTYFSNVNVGSGFFIRPASRRGERVIVSSEITIKTPAISHAGYTCGVDYIWRQTVVTIDTWVKVKWTNFAGSKLASHQNVRGCTLQGHRGTLAVRQVGIVDIKQQSIVISNASRITASMLLLRTKTVILSKDTGFTISISESLWH